MKGILNKTKRRVQNASLIWRLSASAIDFLKFRWYSRLAKKIYTNGVKEKDNDRISSFNLRIEQEIVPITFRPAQGDLLIFHEVFIERQYKLPAGIKALNTVLDLGGNVGYSSLFFFKYYRASKVILVEPSKRNLEVAKRNLNPQYIGGDKCIFYPYAIYHKKGSIYLDDSLPAYNLKVHEEPRGNVRVNAISVNDILEEQGIKVLDLVKMDIEGAERFLLQDNTGWLAHVKLIVMELHKPLEVQWLLEKISPFGFEIAEKAGRTITAVNRNYNN